MVVSTYQVLLQTREVLEGLPPTFNIFSQQLIVTAGEDCTCRVWDLEGKQLKMIKEHIGRGVWRCLYDPTSLDLSNLLGELKDMVVDMGTEIDKQTKALDHYQDDVDMLDIHVKGANQRTRRLLGK
ncbi:Putative SNAP25 homologous protein SNAP30 [Linum perenne]